MNQEQFACNECIFFSCANGNLHVRQVPLEYIDKQHALICNVPIDNMIAKESLYGYHKLLCDYELFAESNEYPHYSSPLDFMTDYLDSPSFSAA